MFENIRDFAEEVYLKIFGSLLALRRIMFESVIISMCPSANGVEIDDVVVGSNETTLRSVFT